MWTCKRCTVDLKFSEVEPAVDHFGCYFLCPRCGYRNKLKNVGPRDGDFVLAQTGD